MLDLRPATAQMQVFLAGTRDMHRARAVARSDVVVAVAHYRHEIAVAVADLDVVVTVAGDRHAVAVSVAHLDVIVAGPQRHAVVVAVAELDVIVAVACNHRVGAAAGLDVVVAVAQRQEVIAFTQLDVVVAVAQSNSIVAAAEMDLVFAIAGSDGVVAVAALGAAATLRDLVVAVAKSDGVVAVVELDLVLAVAVADDGVDSQAAAEPEAVVAAEADRVNGGDSGERLVVDIDVIELAIDIDACAASLARADRRDVELIAGVAAHEVESIVLDRGARGGGERDPIGHSCPACSHHPRTLHLAHTHQRVPP